MAVEEIILRITGESSGGESALDKVSQSLRRFGAILTGVSDAALVTFAKLGEGGAKIEALERKFGSMARAFGQSADEMLATWQKAAAGTMSRAELMRKANQAALLGLPVDRLADLLAIARNAAEATGESVDYMFQSLVTGIGRQSKLILDNLGIVFTATEAYEAYGRKIGKAADALTANERQLAFLEATLKAAARQEAILGGATDNAATKIAAAKAAVQDAKDALAKAFVPVAAKAAEIVQGLANAFNAIPEPVMRVLAQILALVAGAGALVGPVMMLKGSLPMISGLFKTLSVVIGGSLASIAPLIAAILALVGVIKLAAKAWEENWGGIRDTIQSILDTVKPILDGIASDVRYWVGEIKGQLAGIMAAIRAIVEPALARLRELFGDGAGLREFLVTVRDAVNVLLSLVNSLLESLRLLLEGKSKEAWDPLADAALNVITLIVIGWRKYISKALSYGWNLVVNLANGIIRAAKTVLKAAANFIGQIIGRFLAPGSPPREGPLRGITEWGKGLIDTYLRGFALADFGILKETLQPLRQALESAVAMGDISRPEMLSLFREVRGDVAALIADFRKTGEIGDEALGAIAAKLGEAGAEYTKYLRLTLEHQQALDRLKAVQAEVTAAEKAGFIPAELKAKLRAAEDEAKAKEDAVNWQREYLAALQEGVDLQAEMLEAIKDLTEAMQGLGAGGAGIGLAPEDMVTPEAMDLGGVESAFEGFGSVFSGFSDEFNRVKEEVRAWFEGLPARVGGWIETVRSTISQKWEEIKTNLRTTLLMIAAIILGWLLKKYTDISTWLEKTKETIAQKWEEAKTAVVTWVEQIYQTIAQKWEEAKTAVETWMGQIYTTIETTWTNVKTAVSDAWDEIVSTIATKIEEAWNTLNGWIDSFTQIGSNIINGLLGGLKSAWESVKNWFQDRLDDLPGWAKDALGIGSPSRVFEEIGRNMARGLTQGFNLAGLRAQVQANLTGLAPATAGAGGGRVVVVQIGDLSLPGIQSGRDAESLLDRLQEIADRAATSSYALGGVMD